MTVLGKAWTDIGALDDIPRQGARLVRTPAGCIAVFRTLEDRCPHKGGPLSQGIVHGAAVTCPLHNWVISLESGTAQDADEGWVKTYAIKVVNGRLLIDGSAITSRDGGSGEPGTCHG
jgi:nitrite reductase (NADH) small subunit